MSFSEIIHTILEIIPLIAALIVLILLYRSKKRKKVDIGWKFVYLGFLLLTFGLFVDIFEDFVFKGDKFLLLRTFLEGIVGDFLGFVFLIMGFRKWIPKIQSLEATYKDLEESYEQLLSKLNSNNSEIDDLKKTLINRVSHDLRTPLNGIIGCVEIIMGMDITEEQKVYLNEANKSSDDLLNAINSMLDLKEVEEDLSKVVKSHFNIRNSIHNIYKAIKDNNKKNSKIIRVNIESTVPNRVYGPKIYFEKFFTNFIENLYSINNGEEIIINIFSSLTDNFKIVLNIQVALEGKGNLVIENSSTKTVLIYKLLDSICGTIEKEKTKDLENSVYNISIPFSTLS